MIAGVFIVLLVVSQVILWVCFISESNTVHGNTQHAWRERNRLERRVSAAEKDVTTLFGKVDEQKARHQSLRTDHEGLDGEYRASVRSVMDRFDKTDSLLLGVRALHAAKRKGRKS